MTKRRNEDVWEYEGRWWTKQNDVIQRYHRFLWESYNGEIPMGYIVHHIDKKFMLCAISVIYSCLKSTQ